MNASKLQACVDLAINDEPPDWLLNYCGDYYSPYYNLMHTLSMHSNHPRLIVELGVHTGRGIFSMLHHSSLIIGIDCNPTAEAIRLCTYHVNFLYLKQSSLPPPDALLEHKTISILHIDTEHSYANAKQEFEAYSKYLRPGSVVLFDDIHAMNDGVLKFVNEIQCTHKIIDDRLHPICGYAVVLI